MFVKFIVSIALCLLVSRVDGASPTIAPTVGINDFQIQGNGKHPGVSVGPFKTSAIFVIGTDGGSNFISKCPANSIAYSDCDTWLRGDEYFYDYDQTTLLDGTNGNPTVKLNVLAAYGTGNYYGGNLYFLNFDGNTRGVVYRCTGKSKCSKYLDATVAPVSSTGLQDFIMSSTGVMYLSDNDNGKVWKCTGASSAGVGTCTDLRLISGGIGSYDKIALDPTETYIYVRDSSNTQIVKCAISTGACSVYLQSTTIIGRNLANTAITLATVGSNNDWGIAVDSTGSVYFYLGDVYKCTAVDTCSLFLNGRGINPNADDDPSTISSENYGIKIDSSGFMYLATGSGITRYGTGASPASSSSSSSSLNAKMYGIIVLVLFPFAAYFACGYLFAKHRFGYTQAATKETEMVTHTTSV
jgi:sugar lactone lactonase YvrE